MLLDADPTCDLLSAARLGRHKRSGLVAKAGAPKGAGACKPLPRGALVNPLKPSGGCWFAGHSPLPLSSWGMAALCRRAAGTPPAGQPARADAGPLDGWFALRPRWRRRLHADGWLCVCVGGWRRLLRYCCLMPAALPCSRRPTLCRCRPLPSPSLPCFMGRSMQLTSPYACAWSAPGAGRLLHTACATCLPSCSSRLTAAYLCRAPSCGGD